ncbi:MAG TPA: hypothetical protein VF070_29205 [Streptosporangiaceae bacterium]
MARRDNEGIEDLLRDAYTDAAQTVRQERMRPAVSLPPARDRRRWSALVPLAAAAAVVVAIAGAVAVPRLLTTRVAPGTGGVKPPPFIVQIPYFGGAVEKLAVQAAGTHQVTGLVPPPHGLTWVAVAATGSPTTFVTAAVSYGRNCVTAFYRLALSADGKPAGLRPLGVPQIQGDLASLAASADGRTIAYAATPCIVGTPVSRTPVSGMIGVVGTGGTARHWTLPQSTVAGSLSLSADGGILGFVTMPFGWFAYSPSSPAAPARSAWLLPTKASSGNALSRSRQVLATRGGSEPQAVVLSPDGKTVYAMTASGNGPYTITLAAYRPSDGALFRELVTWRNVPVLMGPEVTLGGDRLLVWGIHQPDTYQVDLASGHLTRVWMYAPGSEYPEAVAWLFSIRAPAASYWYDD